MRILIEAYPVAGLLHRGAARAKTNAFHLILTATEQRRRWKALALSYSPTYSLPLGMMSGEYGRVKGDSDICAMLDR